MGGLIEIGARNAYIDRLNGNLNLAPYQEQERRFFGDGRRTSWRASARVVGVLLTLSLALFCASGVSLAQSASSDDVPVKSKEEQKRDAQARELMRKLLGCDANGVQTRYPSVAKIVGRAESKIVEDSYATIPLYYGTGEYVAQYGPWGIVVTNWHVVSESDKTIDVCFPSKKYPARVVLRDEKWDLAALIIPKPEKLRPIPLSLNVPYFEDRLWAGGYGPTEGLDDFELHEGRLKTYVSLDLPKDSDAKGGVLPGEDGVLYETEMIDVGVRSGDSGGPIFNEYGELAGCLWGSDKKSSMGTNSPRILIFIMEAIQEAAKLHAQKISLAETTRENPDVIFTIGQSPNVCVKANAKLSSFAEEDAFAVIKQLTRDGAIGERFRDLDVTGIDVRLYPVSTEPLYVSGNGVDTPESISRLGTMKAKHVGAVAQEYWKRNAGGLPPSPPIYSPGYLGLQILYGSDLPEVAGANSFDALDSRARLAVEEEQRPKPPAADPMEGYGESSAEFKTAAATRAAAVPEPSSDPNVDGVTAASDHPIREREPRTRISQFQAYAIFCVILVMLCASAILLRTEPKRDGKEKRR